VLGKPRAARRQLEKHVLSGAQDSASNPEVSEILEHCVDACDGVGLDPLLAFAQMVLETRNLTSEWWRPPRRNLAGIGGHR
jgi:hypothetical protein